MANIFSQDCKKCDLSLTRTNIVWGKGALKSKLVLIGEAPGEKEDLLGSPFVGRSGALLDEALVASFGPNFLKHVYITNMVKCRPPGNRNPTSKEKESCEIFLTKELEIIKPNLLVTLGKVASEHVLKRPVKITKEHGNLTIVKQQPYIMVCYHPAYILRNQKPELRNSFFQVFVDARRIAHGTNAGPDLFTRSIR